MHQEEFEQETESIIDAPSIVEEETAPLLNQNFEKAKQKRKISFAFLNNYLLLKHTLISAWKSKLQLIILLLLTAFSTAIVTGSWVSYQRIRQGETYLEMNKDNFDAVLPLSVSKSVQIVDQAFSLKLGRLYYQEDDKESSSAVYFDNSIIGQQINPLKSTDLKIEYKRTNNMIDGITSFEWSNPERPLTFNIEDSYVKPSLYGQLMTKAQTTNNATLANYYLSAAQDLYNNLFVNYSAKQILDSLQTYFAQWIEVNSSSSKLTLSSDDFTNWLVTKKVNYQASDSDKDFNIPDDVNVASDEGKEVLAKKIFLKDDLLVNPKYVTTNDDSTENYGMNGQWMTIYRDFESTSENLNNKEIISNFSQNYHSVYSFNNVVDGNIKTDNVTEGNDEEDNDKKYNELNTYSYHFAAAAAALQNRSINIVNQLVGPAGADAKTGQPVNVKLVDLGTKKNHNNVNLKIFQGLAPSNKNEVVISPQYARQKNIKPGNSIVINNKTFMVSGIGSDARNIYPTLNLLDPVPNTRTEFIAYVLPDAYHTENWFGTNTVTNNSLMYFLPWENVQVDDFDIPYFNDYYQRTVFNNNKVDDRNQIDYDQYLIEKYSKNNDNVSSKYQIENNLVVTKDNNQFSNYNRGNKVLNATLAGFKAGVIVGVVFLVVIIIFITYLIIKKAIQKDQVSVGILKSTGYSTGKILSSYIAYPILVSLLAVPIGWLIGLVFQIYFTELFNTMFSLPYNVFSFNAVPLVVAIALIAGFVLVATLLSGYRLLKQQALQLIQNNLDISISNTKVHSNSQSNLGFKGRFLLSLTKTNWKKIAITSLVISIATLAITATISIPATISGMKNNYFKTQKYQNYYQYQDPIPNMPLSKYGLSAWSNLDNLNNENYYPVAATMPWPNDIIINDSEGNKLAYYNPLDYQGDENSNNFASIIKFYDSNNKDQNMIDRVGKYLSNLTNGPLDLNLVAWNYSWLGGRSFSNSMMKDLASIDQSRDKNFSSSVINFASTLLPGILNVTNPGVPPGIDAIPEILKETLPGFIRQILDNQSTDAYDYFSIGHNNIVYNPLHNDKIGGAEDELLTQLQLGSADSNLVKAGFLDVSGINPETKMLVINSDLVKQLKYDSSKNIVPMVINKSFAAKYHLSVGETINAAPNIKTLYYRNNQGVLRPVPKTSWYYGSDPLTQTNDSKTLWNNNANRWNYRGQKPIGDTGYNDAFGYNYDGFYDSQGKEITKETPENWNDVNQIWLKLPDDIDAQSKNGMLADHVYKNANFSFDIENIALHGTGATWIKPFSFDIADVYKGKELNPVNLLTARIPEWYGAMLEKGILVASDSLQSDSLKNEVANKFPEWWSSIVGSSTPITKYHIIGMQNSYDTPRAYIDQKWANLLSGYSYYNDRSETKDPVYRIDSKDDSKDVYQYFSGKLSASDNIYDLVGRMAFKRQADDYSMYGSPLGNAEEPIVADNDLIAKKQEMLNKMTDIATLASLLFIIVTIICSILIVIMITDTFLEQFRRFMNQMKAEGYTNAEINSFTLGVFTPWVFLSYLAGYGLGYLIVFAFIKIVINITGLALPFAFIWWIIPISFAIIALIYFSTYIINIVQLSKMNLISLLQTN